MEHEDETAQSHAQHHVCPYCGNGTDATLQAKPIERVSTQEIRARNGGR